MKKVLIVIAIMSTIMLTASCQKELPDSVKNIDVTQGDNNTMSNSTPESSHGDESPNQSLEGTWKGNMYISISYDGRTYDATYTEITFLKDPYAYSSGNGYWVDYYSDAPWDYVANHIDWKVDYGIIYIHFVEEGTSLRIFDYHLNEDRFYGLFNDSGHNVEFELYHTSSPNWNIYHWGYDYWLNN